MSLHSPVVACPHHIGRRQVVKRKVGQAIALRHLAAGRIVVVVQVFDQQVVLHKVGQRRRDVLREVAHQRATLRLIVGHVMRGRLE